MRDFDQQLLRLKAAARVTSDQEVAALLGMSKAAFSDRKRRGSFPGDKVFALAKRRPDLVIDAEFVLTGSTAKDRYIAEHRQPPADYETLVRYAAKQALSAQTEQLTDDEKELVRLFRSASLKQKMDAVAVLSGSSRSKGKGVKVKGSNNRTAGHDYHE
ncbi:TPA: bacteriophage CI repressor [Pseudomonas aeruginosa]|uniref:helix-turn-helix domain-containing protein n=1 Tax=Pseudomonas aeruginosa TaxID=287 RepID=UPI0009FB1773|nr:helix-turn-helix domain-containing protein [Pseudomonas aeruginosa]NNB79139.1 bacteriophage CI repressor [Pseudomonas aeruginosa]ORE41872.1 hypothetical protein B1H15_26040 [Pseudomonas aeruginosa]HBN8473966.1 helix-turn-helix domain-containing protein [Pseudomonas aeruginosa]HBO7181203.1 bacteriophage CI repressor [Pseudomonas aeruginosa]HCE7623308.1 helix-turn-helix domain-containing protein [Pseudomonas aeruginosa]